MMNKLKEFLFEDIYVIELDGLALIGIVTLIIYGALGFIKSLFHLA